MEVRNCRSCRKIFNYISGPYICPACREKEEEKFQEAKKYVSEHKGVNIAMLAEAIDVEQKTVTQWIREERLEFAEGDIAGIGCESCGAPIRSGKYCESCKQQLTNGLNSAYGKSNAAVENKMKREDQKKHAGMHFFDK